MRKISIIVAIVFLSLYTVSCTPEVLAEEEYTELQATEGDDGDVTPPPPPPPPPNVGG
ncbi:hypothetical protein U8527_02480 [Kordia algicida OT-1]|uniref:Uncharacterized protein n=1 Tax=Kordia algicida OT-1 TaxID=391587 RepID=A9DNF3_9FLAO|nr:hypothetical protein [Kordia algicida]EDP97177.1 hypothetical protein KAOT1_18482 [Kordia algicida OT-1]